ncbi:MAG: O-methyltransferase [Micrococcales bacterium]
MADKITSWKYTEDAILEDDVLRNARARAEELGVECITPSVGATLSMLVNSLQARSIVEVGSGTGVSAIYLLRGSNTAVLATIDNEQEHTNATKSTLADEGIAANRLRIITGKATEVLANLADAAYDLVLLDADRETLDLQLGEASRMLRPGGVIAIAHALWRDRVPDPAMRDEATQIYRDLIRQLLNNDEFATSLLPIGDGLLLASKR